MKGPTLREMRARYEPRLRYELADLKFASTRTSGGRHPVELDQQSVRCLSRWDAFQGQTIAADVEARRHRIRAIEGALERLAEDAFGFCSECGRFIGRKRLDRDPTATCCAQCLSQMRCACPAPRFRSGRRSHGDC